MDLSFLSKIKNPVIDLIRILIVENDEDLRNLYVKIFRDKEKYAVAVAENGMVGVEKFLTSKPKPDVILMDNEMPVLNGIDAMKIILDFDEDAKVVFITADKTIKKEVISMGAFGLLDKTITVDKLVKFVDSMVVDVGNIFC